MNDEKIRYMLSTEFISWQKSEYDLTAEPVIIKYQDFIIKLIKDGDMKMAVSSC